MKVFRPATWFLYGAALVANLVSVKGKSFLLCFFIIVWITVNKNTTDNFCCAMTVSVLKIRRPSTG
jgi:hypothetical protein